MHDLVHGLGHGLEKSNFMNKKKRASLQDVADQVGITKMTVSRFLRNPDQVSAIMQQKIAIVIERLGYIPNRAPEMLLNAKSYVIGVLIPSLTNLVFSEVIRGIESVTTPAGYQTMLAHYGYDINKEEKSIESLLSYNIDGLLLSESNHSDKTLRMIENAGIPTIEMMDITPFANQTTNQVDLNNPLQKIQRIGFDNIKASCAMIERMVAKGYKHIVYLGARLDIRTQLKFEGYQQAMLKNGLMPISIMSEDASSFSLGAQLLQQALKQYPQIDGIFCTNDDLAIGVIFECLRQKISIPDQIAVAGFHGHDVGQAMYPKLASVITPRKSIGITSATTLISRLHSKSSFDINIDLGFIISDGESI
ncbi:d-gluconate inducible gluconate regulon transcriptional repressor [Gammaproteobacteria bacterium]|nr:d-gluconate inducible gluconate regulon transcriptional repressor [Gammaproteobacteria bacterium]